MSNTKSIARVMGASVFVSTLAGCGSFDLASLLGILPVQIPDTIAAQRAILDQYPPEAHPLNDVPVGTVIDGIENIDGCWIGYELRDADESDPLSAYQDVEQADWFQFDGTTGEVTNYSWLRTANPSGSGRTVLNAREVTEFHVLGADRISQKVVNLQITMGVDPPEADLVQHALLTLSISWFRPVGTLFNTGQSFETVVTIQGDFMKTLEGGIGSPPDPNSEYAFVQLWVRVPCPEE